MAKKNTPSSIDKLLPELQELIGQLRGKGRTIDEIRAKLLELDVEVSRSALGRHVKSLADAQVTMQRSRQMAEALVAKFGEDDKPDDKIARLNIEMAHGLLMRLMLSQNVDEETGEATAIVLSPQDAMFVAKAVQSLTSASKVTEDRIATERERAKKRAIEAVERVAKKSKGGLTKQTVEDIKREILGLEK